MRRNSKRRKLYHFLAGLSLIGLSLLMAKGCAEEIDSNPATRIDTSIVKPKALSQVHSTVDIEVSSDNHDETAFIEVFIKAIGEESLKKIAKLDKPPYSFKWNSHTKKDGRYILSAVAVNYQGREFYAQSKSIQVVNSPLSFTFTNCTQNQFIRGSYSLVVAVKEKGPFFKAPPTLTINQKETLQSLEKNAPYRYLIPTEKYKDGETLELVVTGVDTVDRKKSIRCTARVDNSPPSVRFASPKGDDPSLGREFTVTFDAQDRFGVKEVRLWVDGLTCGKTASSVSSASCEPGALWVGTQKPSFPITVKLPSAYKADKTLYLTARSTDLAGNTSEPPARLQIQIDPIIPSIFIISPKHGEIVKDKVDFIAKVTDNNNLKSITFHVEKTKWTKTTQVVGNEKVWEKKDTDVSSFGPGVFTFVVTAKDVSNNVSVAKRIFRIGCGDSGDCPINQICHKSKCMIPAGTNQPCGPDIPCDRKSVCTRGEAPFCADSSPKTYCRQRCRPGNKYVPAESCGSGFFCSRTKQVCLPADGCTVYGTDPTYQCQSHEQCVLVDRDSGICIPVGSVPNGSECKESCDGRSNCQRGSWCIFLSKKGRSSCATLCLPSRGTACQPGEKCVKVSSAFGGEPYDIGACIKP